MNLIKEFLRDLLGIVLFYSPLLATIGILIALFPEDALFWLLIIVWTFTSGGGV